MNMTVSALIAQLTQLKQKHGNLQVRVGMDHGHTDYYTTDIDLGVENTIQGNRYIFIEGRLQEEME